MACRSIYQVLKAGHVDIGEYNVETLVQSIANGLVTGFMYILVALGLTLVFSIMRIVQFAHGEIYMLGAYAVFFLNVALGVNIVLALVIAAAILAIVGILMEKFLFRPFRGNVEKSIIISIGLIILLQTVAAVFFGTQERNIPDMISGVLKVGFFRISYDRLITVGVGIILTVFMFLFIQKTRTGQAMVAVSQELDGAALQGINVNRISAIALALGCSLAAVAGGLMGSLFKVGATMGTGAMASGIAVIILGGLGNIPGAVVGGIILGLISGVIPVYASQNIASIASFILIIVILFIRPNGLFGKG
jgi:branched-chain amino acid transport system permease protein